MFFECWCSTTMTSADRESMKRDCIENYFPEECKTHPIKSALKITACEKSARFKAAQMTTANQKSSAALIQFEWVHNLSSTSKGISLTSGNVKYPSETVMFSFNETIIQSALITLTCLTSSQISSQQVRGAHWIVSTALAFDWTSQRVAMLGQPNRLETNPGQAQLQALL